MKTKIFSLLLIAIFALSISAQAQDIGGDDILISEISSEDAGFPKISVADNGWIYILTYTYCSAAPYTSLMLHCSKDDGVTYQKLKEWKLSVNITYSDADMVVTGNSEANINVWIAFAVNNSDDNSSTICVSKHAADGTFIEAPYTYKNIGFKAYRIAIATDYRSPGDGASPFAIGIAFTDYVNSSNKSWVNYAYSLDGGNTFNLKSLQSAIGERQFGRIDISLGRSRYDKFGMVGIAFEMGDAPQGFNSWRNIGFLANYMDYRNTHAWSAPVNISKVITSGENNTRNPKVQWFGNKDVNPTIHGTNSFNFIVAFDQKFNDHDFDINYIYPATSFKIDAGYTPALSDFEYTALGEEESIEHNVALSFDKQYNHYLATYIEYGSSFKIKYKYINADKIHDKANWVDLGSYSNDDAYSTSIDISPTKNMVCWAWSEGSSIWADTEWSTVGIENHEISTNALNAYPNPASNVLNIVSENANELITICDLSGKVVYSEQASEKQSSIDISQLSAGMYIVRIGDKAVKLVKE
ncbi:MAG: T9SS type A sorting domain-containing protein [Bacteroidales bacterium]|nr:T9SS type A sorting domain-containing protein [Bacteroidales bacterium]